MIALALAIPAIGHLTKPEASMKSTEKLMQSPTFDGECVLIGIEI